MVLQLQLSMSIILAWGHSRGELRRQVGGSCTLCHVEHRWSMNPPRTDFTETPLSWTLLVREKDTSGNLRKADGKGGMAGMKPHKTWSLWMGGRLLYRESDLSGGFSLLSRTLRSKTTIVAVKVGHIRL
jgi:hypothetical protein